MNKSIVMLTLLMASQFSLAHVADQGQLDATDDSRDLDVGVHEIDGAAGHPFLTIDANQQAKSRTIESEGELLALTPSDGVKTLQTDEDQYRLATHHGTGLHPTLKDPDEAQQFLPQDKSLVHVDFSSVSGQSAPLFVEGNNFAVGIYGNAQALNSYEGMPASKWFGDSADSTFVLADGSVQIVFPQDVEATSLLTSTTGIKEKLSAVSDDQGITTLSVALLDANGTMISTSLIHLSDGVKELDVPSEVRFRSLIISSTSTHWMFSNLAYKPDSSEMM
jgi:hypothetical protein